MKGLRCRGGLGWQKKGSIHESCHLWLPRGLGLINDQASWEDVSMQTLSLSHPLCLCVSLSLSLSRPPSSFCRGPVLSEPLACTLRPLMQSGPPVKTTESLWLAGGLHTVCTVSDIYGLQREAHRHHPLRGTVCGGHASWR